MTARALLHLHANSSILASHSPSTGKMRLCTSFQTVSCLLHSTHEYTHTHTLSLLGCPEAKNQLKTALHVLSKRLANNIKGQHVVFFLSPLVRTGLQTATVDGSLEITATQLTWGEQSSFHRLGYSFLILFMPRLRMDSWLLYHMILLKFCFEYPTSSPVLPLASAPALSLPIISFKCQQHTRHTEI